MPHFSSQMREQHALLRLFNHNFKYPSTAQLSLPHVAFKLYTGHACMYKFKRQQSIQFCHFKTERQFPTLPRPIFAHVPALNYTGNKKSSENIDIQISAVSVGYMHKGSVQLEINQLRLFVLLQRGKIQETKTKYSRCVCVF